MVKHLAPLTRYRCAAPKNVDVRVASPPRDIAPIDVHLPSGAKLFTTALHLPDNLHADTWAALGPRLVALNKATQWALGDWWVYGEHRYGERKAAVAAKTLPYEFETLMNFGYVARHVEASRRNEVLTFNHHYAVAALEPAEQQRWLKNAARYKWSVRRLRQKLAERNERELEDRPDERALNWHSDLLLKAQRAGSIDPFCLGEKAWDDPRLDHLCNRDVDELLAAAQQAAIAWQSMASALESYRRRRLAEGAQFIPRNLDARDVPNVDHEASPITARTGKGRIREPEDA